MRLSFLVLLTSLITHVFAGGIRRGYEIIFIWYAYKAETAYLQAEGLDVLNDRWLLRNLAGTGPSNTLKIDEFLDYTGRTSKNTATNLGTVFGDDQSPRVDAAARKLYALMNKRQMPQRWPNPAILFSSGGGYGGLMNTAADTLYASRDAAANADVANSINALQKVSIAREIDYEGHRFDALKNAFPGVTLEYDNVVLQTTKGAKSLNMELTVEHNPNESNLEQRIADWTENTYHADTANNADWGKTEGEVRLDHFNALLNARRAESKATTGVCNF